MNQYKLFKSKNNKKQRRNKIYVQSINFWNQIDLSCSTHT